MILDGDYNDCMENTILTNSLTLGPVELNVQNLSEMHSFYEKVLGLELLTEDKHSITFGFKKAPILILHYAQMLSRESGPTAGLYHFAILFSSQGELARTVYRILQKTPHLFSGSGDHLVSEAFYFNDPEGNGIELYYDRDRSSWKWKDGAVQMATLYIDPKEYLEKYLVLEEQDSSATLGHVHLKVGNVSEARHFYVDILGFDVTAELPSALFISVGGYHHHLGINSWESYGATERTNSLGLKSFSLQLEGIADIDRLKERLQQHEVPFTEISGTIQFFDPWKNQISVHVN